MKKTILATMLTMSLSMACQECGGGIIAPPTDDELKRIQPLCYSLTGAFIGESDSSCTVPSFYTEKNIMLIDAFRDIVNN